MLLKQDGINKKEIQMQSAKDKIVAHRGSTTDVNILLTPEEVEHLHNLLHPTVKAVK